ncbi:unnamed protein product [Amoebophrya sp. A25]|nr:unnamed protein product [Amoebophrya sp. A25]|eukprot:GSA25T00010648001.1
MTHWRPPDEKNVEHRDTKLFTITITACHESVSIEARSSTFSLRSRVPSWSSCSCPLTFFFLFAVLLIAHAAYLQHHGSEVGGYLALVRFGMLKAFTRKLPSSCTV